MEHKDSLRHSQVPATCPYPKPDQSSPWPPLHFQKIYLYIIFPTMIGSSKWYFSLRIPHPNSVCNMPRPSHSSWFDHPNNICWGVQFTKALIMQFSPLPCYLVPLSLKYSPQHPILKHPQPTFLPQSTTATKQQTGLLNARTTNKCRYIYRRPDPTLTRAPTRLHLHP